MDITSTVTGELLELHLKSSQVCCCDSHYKVTPSSDFCPILVQVLQARELIMKDDSFLCVSERESQLLLLGSMRGKPAFCRGVGEGAKNQGELALCGWLIEDTTFHQRVKVFTCFCSEFSSTHRPKT